jgi:NAD(P)-dependent dehydrogenase (short-subunit alcohol dehydrogenase family)
MGVELSPVRINAIHPGPIEDSPFWDGNAAAADMMEGWRKLSLTGRPGSIGDIVDALTPGAPGQALHLRKHYTRW